MSQAYLGIAILFAVGILNAMVMLGLSHLISVRRKTTAKAIAYESGMQPLGDTRQRFSVKFYVVAMLFIVFDIETIFFLPWAVIFRDLGLFGLIEMFVFMGVLAVGLAYAWKKGTLEWD
ncbi:MAG: NADH-quinone oxidoreductase subunit A [Gemmatimonadota bacterium]|nr:NADH-quinone oxidoreductase subunit A [Gemmatimonadota bacterium]MDH3427201.1 NADH-quinone oxidoreductase subunit A [Gemmatimonadota bacterium]